MPVVLHDPTLERTAGLRRAVADMTARELAALPSAARPPTLEQVLDAFGTATDYLVEVKRVPVATEAALLDAVAARGLEDHVTIQSFDHLLLRRLRRRDRGLSLAALFRPGADAVASLELVAPFVDGIGPPASRVDARVMDAAAGRDLAVRPWTVNDAAEMRRLIAAGVDGIITDLPGRARAVIGVAEDLAERALAGASGAERGAAQARIAATSPA